MRPHPMPQFDGKSKPPRKRKETQQGSPGRWVALFVDVFPHEVVGLHAKTPPPADPSKSAWQPFGLWCWLVGEAAWQDRTRVLGTQAIPLRRGQLVVSERYLARAANWSRKSIRSFFAKLALFEMITIDKARTARIPRNQSGSKKGPGISLITICNYDIYQSPSRARGPARAQQGPKALPITQGIQVREKTIDTYSNSSCGRVVADDAAATQSRVLKLVSKEAKA